MCINGYLIKKISEIYFYNYQNKLIWNKKTSSYINFGLYSDVFLNDYVYY